MEVSAIQLKMNAGYARKRELIKKKQQYDLLLVISGINRELLRVC